ncbi:tonB-system energizer ExbB [Paracoccus marcusii]|uniref:Biopolymer transport protein ExbB n=1 Tax=Paracoccus marcusii TaxID=59779 RepID=A0ABY7UUZ1_9RHOB|nr:tonB-system energizer ExbB [Paracoccus marcusii]WDA13256.1 tonB-system energizer ExbB [Paracoccus marcusii]
MTHLPRQPLRAGLAALLVAATLAGAGLAQDVPTTQSQPEAAVPAAPQPAADAAAPAAAPDAAAVPNAATPDDAAAGLQAPFPTQPAAPGQTATPADPADAAQPVPVVAERDPGLPHDLSPMGMFLAADWVVKGVMIGLAVASVITWTILLVKLIELWAASRRVTSATRRIQAAPSLPDALAGIGRRGDPVSRMIRSAAEEYRRSEPALAQAGDHGIKERVASQLDRIEVAAGRRMARGTGVLATIGSTAPFVGLFGTVWGIMNSFIGISESQTTNLAVVAPGIAEALLATAIGLVAAIPAVVIYNVFARAVTGYRMRLGHAAAGVQQMVSRDLDFRGRGPAAGV